jgi:hypothetical protein
MIADMIVWGFFSAIGWMGANWTVERVFPEKEKVMICKKQESDNLICKEELKTSAEVK